MVNRVTRKMLDADLERLEEIAPDSANRLRAFSDYRALIQEHPLDMRDACLALAERMQDGSNRAKELAMYFERLGRREND